MVQTRAYGVSTAITASDSTFTRIILTSSDSLITETPP